MGWRTEARIEPNLRSRVEDAETERTSSKSSGNREEGFANRVRGHGRDRKGIGDALAEGVPRACKKWGRWEDVENGLVRTPYRGYREHYEGRVEVEWSYGTIFTGRDVNEHGLTISIHWPLTIFNMLGMKAVFSAEELVKRVSAAVPESYAECAREVGALIVDRLKQRRELTAIL